MSDNKLATLEGLGAEVATGKKVIVRRIKVCKGRGKSKKCMKIGGTATVTGVPAKDVKRAATFFGTKKKKPTSTAAKKPTGGSAKKPTGGRAAPKKGKVKLSDAAKKKRIVGLFASRLKGTGKGKAVAIKSVCSMYAGSGVKKEAAKALLKGAKLSVKVCKGHVRGGAALKRSAAITPTAAARRGRAAAASAKKRTAARAATKKPSAAAAAKKPHPCSKKNLDPHPSFCDRGKKKKK